MADYHRMRSKYWPDVRGLSHPAKLLGAYILTCTHRITEGLYHLPVGYAAEDLEFTPTKTRKALAELIARDFVHYDEKAQVVLIIKALTYPDQVPKTEPQIKGAVSKLVQVPPSHLWDEFVALAEAHAPALADALRNRSATHEVSHG